MIADDASSSPMMSGTDTDDTDDDTDDDDDNGRTSSIFLRSTTQKALKGNKNCIFILERVTKLLEILQK